MGKMALLIVLALSITVGVVAYTLNKSKTSVVENVTGFDKYTNARNLGHTGVNMMLRKLDRITQDNDTSFFNPLSRGQKVWLAVNAMSGRCSVSIKLANPAFKDTVDLTSSARFLDTSYQMKLRLWRFPKPFPAINSAVGLASTPFDFQMVGNPHIYGENYNMDGSRGNAAYDTTGVTVNSAAESVLVAGYNSKITGDPAKVSITPPDNPAGYVNEYISGADIVFPDGSNNNGTYGSKVAPLLGYVNGHAKFGGGGAFYGVLVVHGTVEFVGNFDMYGLIITYGDDVVVDVSAASGTPQIWGGLLATGPPGSKLTMKGTSDIRYSKEALDMAKYLTKLQAYRVLSWYE